MFERLKHITSKNKRYHFVKTHAKYFSPRYTTFILNIYRYDERLTKYRNNCGVSGAGQEGLKYTTCCVCLKPFLPSTENIMTPRRDQLIMQSDQPYNIRIAS
jgi:hypothetical protein